MVHHYVKLAMVLVALLLLTGLPLVVLAEDNTEVQISVSAVVVGYPGNLTLTIVSDYQVDIRWAKPVDGEYTMIRGAVGRYPTDRDNGYLVYYGDGTFTSDTGVSLDETAALNYYVLWSQQVGTGAWSGVTVRGAIGGEAMTVIGEQLTLFTNILQYLGLPLLFLILTLWKRNLITILAGIFSSIIALPFVIDHIGAWMTAPLIIVIAGLVIIMGKDALEEGIRL